VISSIALGAITVVAMSMASALLLLPVLLKVAGRRLLRSRAVRGGAVRGSHRATTEDTWHRLTRLVMARPITFLAIGGGALLALAVPTTGLTTFTPDAQIVPTSSPVRQGYEQMQAGFGVGSTSPIRVVVEGRAALDTPAASAAVADLVDDLAGLPGVDRVESALPVLAQVAPDDPLGALVPEVRSALPEGPAGIIGHFASADGRRLVLDVVPEGRASDPVTRDLVGDVDRVVDGFRLAGGEAFVGGETAEGLASNGLISDRLPLVVVVMMVVIYLLLLLTFRSVLLPLKAIAMNLLSVAATFGVLVVVFQHGVGAGLLGVEGDSLIQNFVPVLLLTLLFSLSTDYEVFLLSRVREHYRSSGDNTASVAAGMSVTAPLISGAALLMVVVFGAFALSGILPTKQLGFGMAVAIAIDATIVRLLLVPASMRLMGRLNWWAPQWGWRRIRRAPDVLPAPRAPLPEQNDPSDRPTLMEIS
jgi:RND superfamily putative drug exporter